MRDKHEGIGLRSDPEERRSSHDRKAEVESEGRARGSGALTMALKFQTFFKPFLKFHANAPKFPHIS